MGSDHVDIFRLVAGQAMTIDSALSTSDDRLFVLPYAQVRERGFAAVDEGIPIHTMAVQAKQTMPLDQLLQRLPAAGVLAQDLGFNLDDSAFEDRVSRVIESEIGAGAGSNFVLHRKRRLKIKNYDLQHNFSLFIMFFYPINKSHIMISIQQQ